ncbi:MAG TPA: UdgX family uracil-DNA binding protein [Aliidongia sp.]|nr:UdgX family uracil-DNA binding protein [Aliidongia sp.]
MVLHRATLAPGADLDGFRQAVRRFAAAKAAPHTVVWSVSDTPDLFGDEAGDGAPPLALPRAVAELIEPVICHRDPERHALLYTLIWRVLTGERTLLEHHNDPLIHRLEAMRKSVGRDLHKMHAFLRFRRAETDGQERFVAWFEPEHHILTAAAPFFVERFRSLVWSILTPDGSAQWDRERLSVGPPGKRSDAPAEDAFEAGWQGYYESTFNPARTNLALMRSEMPKKYWRNLPETGAIAKLVRSASSRVDEMIEKEAAMPSKRNPDKAVAAMAAQEPASLAELNRIIAASEPLVPGATRAVLGEGPEGAAVAFVGEQPGDQEDVLGRPFVGPAGQLLSRAMAEAGLDRSAAYVTNAVKHFKFEQRGKRRIHQKPTTGEVKHYRWWLMKELDFVRPRIVVALGATAALALAGKPLPITKCRGAVMFDDRQGYITVHPSYLLRLPDEEAKQREYAAFVADLRHVRELVEEQARRAG